MDNKLAEILCQRCILLHILAMSGLIVLETIKSCILLYSLHFNRVPQHTSILSGQDWLNELIAGHDGRFYNKMGMKKHLFWMLLSLLQREASLWDTRHVSSKEQLHQQTQVLLYDLW